MKPIAVCATVLLSMLTQPAAWCAQLDVKAALLRVDASLAKEQGSLLALYADLHAHPELAFAETRTAALLAAQMRSAGFEVTQGVGGTGLVAVLRNGSGPLVMVRTELDGLPMQEQSDLPFASRTRTQYNGADTFTAHTCAHDMHMSIWVGTARAMLAQRSNWRGTLMFIAQPAEERVAGAKAMLADRLFERFGKPDYGFALHTMPGAYDEVLWRAGAMTSNGSALNVTFLGRGGHGSDPSTTIDPVMMASRFVVDLQSVVSREKDPAAFGVVSIGAIQGGSAGNIIPDQVALRGTVRSQSDAVHERLQQGVTRTAQAVAAMAGAPPPQVSFSVGTRSVMNDPQLTARTAVLFNQAFGDKSVQLSSAWSAGEDYTEFQAAGVPSFFFGLGIYEPKRMAAARAGGEQVPANHSPQFIPVAEPTLRTGVRAMSLALLGVMGTAR